MAFFAEDKEGLSILIDVGNGSVTGSLISLSQNDLPVFICTVKEHFPLGARPSIGKLFESLTGVLDTILKNLLDSGLGSSDLLGKDKAISHIVFSFSSPWFYSKTVHLNLKQDSEFVISSTFIEDLVSKESESLSNDLSKAHGEGVHEVVEKSVINTKVNGYTLKDPIGKKASLFDAYLFLSVVEKKLIDIIEPLVMKYTHIPREKIIIHTFPLVMFTVLRDIFSNYSDFVMLDVTGEVSDITLVRDGVIVQTVTMPTGRHAAIRQVSKELNVPNEVALSTLHLFAADKLEAQMTLKMETILASVEKEWNMYLEGALNELDTKMNLPSRLYLTADDDVALLYSKFLKISKIDSTVSFRKNLEIVMVNHEVLSPFFKNKSTAHIDQFISILAIFASKMNKI